MIVALFIAVVGCLFNVGNGDAEVKKFENCKIEHYQKKFDILPGRGWDNLNNKEMGQIMKLSFTECHYSQDNIYLLPNDMSLVPLKESLVELNAQSFSHFANYTSVTSHSINLEAHGSYDGFTASGSFSTEKENVKMDQLETKSSIMRVELRYNIFRSKAEPDPELHPTFRNRIMDMAGIIVQNKDSVYPEYLADMIVRDYGTHVINTIDAGAILSKTDFISSDYHKTKKSDSLKISAAAAASFGILFGVSASYSYGIKQTDIDEYNQNSQKTRIETYGGALYGANFTLGEWRKSVMDNMIPIDRSGDLINFVITTKTLRELDPATIKKISHLLKKAVQRYYSANLRTGCLDINAKNFNSDANVDSNNCESPELSFTFGGVYQSCTGYYSLVEQCTQANPLTGDQSCPPHYQSVLLNSGTYTCQRYCVTYFFIFESCWTECANYELYWCYPVNAKKSTIYNGYRFGGFISNQMKTCPSDYFEMNVGLSAKMCVSINNDVKNQDAIPLGGLYSCSVGNPLTNLNLAQNLSQMTQWPKRCSKGFMSHLASNDNGCELVYCTGTNKFSLGSLPILKRPPFISLKYNPNSTNVNEFRPKNGKMFYKSTSGNWEVKEPKGNHTNAIVGSVLGTLFFVALVGCVALYFQRRHYKKKLVRVEVQENVTFENP